MQNISGGIPAVHIRILFQFPLRRAEVSWLLISFGWNLSFKVNRETCVWLSMPVSHLLVWSQRDASNKLSSHKDKSYKHLHKIQFNSFRCLSWTCRLLTRRRKCYGKLVSSHEILFFSWIWFQCNNFSSINKSRHINLYMGSRISHSNVNRSRGIYWRLWQSGWCRFHLNIYSSLWLSRSVLNWMSQ